jgi:hypothetical protein
MRKKLAVIGLAAGAGAAYVVKKKSGTHQKHK